MKFSVQAGYETRSNLEHFGDVAFHPLGPASIFIFSRSVLASNIMVKRVNGFPWNFQDMSGMAQFNIRLDYFTPDKTVPRLQY